MDWLLHLIKHMIQHAIVHKVDKGIHKIVKAVEPATKATKATIKVVGQVVNEVNVTREATLTDEQRRQRAEREAEEYARHAWLEQEQRRTSKARAKVILTCWAFVILGGICEAAYRQHNETINHARWLDSVSQADTSEQINVVANITAKFHPYGYFIETPDLSDGATIRVQLDSQLQFYVPSRAEAKQIDRVSGEPEAYMTEYERTVYSIYVDLLDARSLTSTKPNNFTLIVCDAAGHQQSKIQAVTL